MTTSEGLSATQQDALLVVSGRRITMRDRGGISPDFWLPSRATLASLERAGLIRHAGAGSGARFYDLTDAGASALRAIRARAWRGAP